MTNMNNYNLRTADKTIYAAISG